MNSRRIIQTVALTQEMPSSSQSSGPVCLCVTYLSGAYDQLQFAEMQVSSLTRGRGCILQLLLGLASAFI
jgi:hypothetical protein